MQLPSAEMRHAERVSSNPTRRNEGRVHPPLLIRARYVAPDKAREPRRTRHGHARLVSKDVRPAWTREPLDVCPLQEGMLPTRSQKALFRIRLVELPAGP